MNSFIGQQEDERVLCSLRPHWIHEWIGYGQLAMSILVLVLVMGGIGVVTGIWLLTVSGVILGMLMTALGWWWVKSCDAASITYITDRRVVRFAAFVPWNVVSRSLGWDEVVKLKTFSTNPIWKLLKVGTVVVHARTTVVPSDDAIATNDDIAIDYVEYYADLGHYLDKVLFYYKRQPEQLAAMREFVAKPKGQRF